MNKNKPFFFVHQSYQQRKRLPECISYINNLYGDLINVGTIIRLPTLPPKSARKFAEQCCEHTDLIIVDPEIYTHENDKNLAKKTASYYKYMSDKLPKKKNQNWIKSILNIQRKYGATLLLTPSNFLYAIKPELSLQNELTTAEKANELISKNEKLVVNLTISHFWLTDKRCRDVLLNELIDSDFDTFYIRVYWPHFTPRYGQLSDVSILKGYRELSTYMGLEDKILILPTTNLTGWISTALGAGGFSIGPSKDQQSFSEELQIRRPKGVPTAQRKERYFERSLLHVIELEAHDSLLTTKGYQECNCKYCDELNAINSSRSSLWDHEAASLHQLVQTAELTSLLNNKNPRGRALKEVKKSREFYESIEDIKIQGENKPRHIEVWEDLLE